MVKLIILKWKKVRNFNLQSKVSKALQVADCNRLLKFYEVTRSWIDSDYVEWIPHRRAANKRRRSCRDKSGFIKA